MDDEKILDLYWARNEDAILETAKKYGKYCLHISHSILDSTEDAEECVNESYLHIWNSIPPHRPSPLKIFLGKITRNLSLQRWHTLHAKKRGGGQVSLALEELEECISDSNSDSITDNTAIKDALNRFLHTLPKEDRIMFVLRYWYFFSIEELHNRTGFSESRIKSSLYRSRQKLRRLLELEGIEL